MISQLIDQAFLRNRIPEIVELLKSRSNKLATADAGTRERAEAAGVTEESLKEAAAKLDDIPPMERPGEREAAWLPCDPHLSLIQSSLEEAYRSAGAVDEGARRGLAGEPDPITDLSLKEDWIPRRTRPFMRQAEESDAFGWGLSFAVARAIRALHGRSDFPSTPQTLPLGGKARLILVGDWASGVPRAAKVADQIKLQLATPEAADRDCHVIHLGDVYYAGRSFEYDLRIHDPWPVTSADSSKVKSWCLAGNHDMFAGGQPYFDFLNRDNRFAHQGGCSYFALENEHWLILGLDSSYTLEGLKGDVGALALPQWQWIKDLAARIPNKKVMLLSHHQPFSAWEEPSPKLVEALAPLLRRSRAVEAWFWGHEHRCAVYAPTNNIKYPALIGHGGVPVYSSNKAPKQYAVRYFDQRKFTHMMESFSYMGFAVVDLDGASGHVRYIDEKGVKRTEIDNIG
jgi:hypothetical protein